MLLGALVDAGVSPELLQQTTVALNLGATLTFDSVDRSGITARKAHILVGGHEADAPHSTRTSKIRTTTDHNARSRPFHGHEQVSGHSHQHGRNLPAIREI